MGLKGSPGTARLLNRRLVLNRLRHAGPMSRADLAGATGLSPAAVTLVTAELMSEDLLVEGEHAVTSAGRRPVPLNINYAARLAIGIKMTEHHLVGVLTDLSTRVIRQETLAFDSVTPDAVVNAASRLVRQLAPSRDERARLAGVGVGLPGLISTERGVVLESYRLGWSEVPLASLLAQRVEVPVWIDNDVNAYGVAQHLFGHGRRTGTLAVITVGRGIGASLLINGRLHNGKRGAAAELGHVLVQEGGRPCECGRLGCLEAYASEPSMLAIWNERVAGVGDKSIDDFFALAAAGDPDCTAVLHQAGHQLGLRVADMVNLLDPDLLVIGGESVRFGPLLFDALRAALAQRVFYKVPPLLIAEWGEDAWVRGAAALAIQRFFDFEAAAGLTSDSPRSPTKRPI